jgi:hypothetical protein
MSNYHDQSTVLSWRDVELAAKLWNFPGLPTSSLLIWELSAQLVIKIHPLYSQIHVTIVSVDDIREAFILCTQLVPQKYIAQSVKCKICVYPKGTVA